MTNEIYENLLEILPQSSVYVIEHDWASAFKGAQDFESGEIHLPDDFACFEFRISGFHCIATMAHRQFEDGTVNLAVQTPDGWLTGRVDGVLRDLIYPQIRAVLIALEAEVATKDVVRAPHKLNHAREKRGAPPISDYHVVSLARRSRASALPHDGSEEPAYRMRCHFRRGHWRHFDDHKTWIKWTLAGNPDLGFIEKHYRL